MNQNYVEIVVKEDIEAGDLLGMLEDGEFLGSWEESGVLHIYWPEDRWRDAVLEDVKRVLAGLGIGAANITVNAVEDQDWNATWAASLKPVRLGRNIRIRQSWNPGDPAFDGIELILDPKRAFGTGYHATTQLVIEWLEGYITGGERVLDIGSGSGILSMLAIRLGASSALAVDIDAVAQECALEYAELNGFGPELEFRIASFENLGPDRYDVILANIDGRTLPILSGFLPALLQEGGAICYSGLQQKDFEEVAGALAKAGFQIMSQMQRDEWLALEIKSFLHVAR